MPPVFGRQLGHTHPYDAAISAWLGRSGPDPINCEYRAMGRNIMHDHRVNLERELLFDSLMNMPRTDLELRDALIDYKYSWVQTSRGPHFIDESINGNNLVSGSAGTKQVINKDTSLVRVLDLSGLVPVFQWAKRNGHQVFANFPSNCSGQNVDKWIYATLQAIREHKFVEACLEVMNDYKVFFPFEPTWSAAWNRFEPFLKEGPNRWLQVMGMAREFPSRWLMLLRYTVREAGTVARPTQLEVGWGPRHFPSPPKARRRRGGHPMDLNITPLATSLLSEFIHRQIGHTMAHWTAAGGKLERTTGPTTGRLDSQRESHHRLLVMRYGRDVLDWMPRSI